MTDKQILQKSSRVASLAIAIETKKMKAEMAIYNLDIAGRTKHTVKAALLQAELDAVMAKPINNKQ